MTFKVGDIVGIKRSPELSPAIIWKVSGPNDKDPVYLVTDAKGWNSGYFARELTLGYSKPTPAPKKLNFWEAREMALAGKQVSCEGEYMFTSENFEDEDMPWFKFHLEGEWEVVELVDAPQTETWYVNVYPGYYGDWDLHSSLSAAKDAAHPKRLGTIAITVDENGQLITAKNVLMDDA